MYIGKLNHLLPNFTYSVTKSFSDTVPAFLEEGNPFAGELLSVSWKELIASGVDLRFSWEGNFRINRVVLHLNEKCAPASIEAVCHGKTIYTYVGETEQAIREKVIAIPVEKDTDELLIRIESDFSTVALDDVEIFGADLSGLGVFPVPAKIEEEEGALDVAALTTVTLGCPEARQAFAVLSEKYCEITGVSLTEAPQGDVALEKDESLGENAYRLTVSEEGVRIAASDLRGFVMGGETLLKLVSGGTLPLCRVEDAPFKSFRGVHWYLPAEDQMEFAKRLVKYVISPMGYNYMIVEVCGAMEFTSHPEINEAFEKADRKYREGLWPRMAHGMVGGGKTVSQAAVRDFVDYVRSFGIDVIPEIQSLSHVQFMTLAHPEIAEIPEFAAAEGDGDTRNADASTGTFFAHSFCPSNPKSYEILFDLAEEILEVFRPRRFVHMGHDEVYQIGVCPVCSQKNPADIFAEDVNRLHDYLAEKGLTMMIWADMLQPVSKYQTPSAIDRIPKDIVLLDFIWYFHLTKDIEDNLLQKGFRVAIGNLYSSHFPRYEARIRKENIWGGQISAWVETNESQMQQEGKLYDFLFTGGMLWSESYVGHCRYSYDELIRRFLPALRQQVQNRSYPSLEENAEVVSLYEDVFDPAAVKDFSAELNTACRSLVLCHYTGNKLARIPWTDLEEIGHYTVTYEDGSEEIIPVTYGGNVSHYARRQNEPFRKPYYRHNGYSAVWSTDGIREETVAGEEGTVYCLEWINPRPEKAIRTVTFEPVGDNKANFRVRRVLAFL